MPLDNLSDLSALLAAVSLATERLVVIVKTMFPRLGAERAPSPGQSPDEADRGRRLTVILIAYVCALVTSLLVADGWEFTYGDGGRAVSVFAVALLASGGSAFWTQVMSFASAAKDVRQYEKRRLQREAGGPAYEAPVHAPDGGAATFVPSLPVPPR